MNLTEKALSAAKTLGGKSGLNCIAELDPTAIEQAKKSALRLALITAPYLYYFPSELLYRNGV